MFVKRFEKDFPEEERSFYRWESDYYKVEINKADCGLTRVYVSPKCGETQPRYLPEMFVRDDDIMPESVVIQTTSYGTLSPEEIRAMQKALSIAVEEAEVVQKQFIDPIRAGTFQF